VDSHWETLTRHCVAYVNIDNPGITGTSVPDSQCSLEVKAFLSQVVKESWGEYGTYRLPYKGGDQSFFGVGVPYISFATGYTPEELERLNWASLSPWLHTEADTLDKIDQALFEQHLHFFANLVVRLCNARTVPYELPAIAGKVASQLAALKEMADGIAAIDLDDLIKAAGRLQKTIRAFDACVNEYVEGPGDTDGEVTRLVNETLIGVLRDLSSLWAAADKYDQDPYGYSLIGKPIPRLYVPIKQMTNLSTDDEKFYLWTTQFMRERNRVSDSIGNAIGRLTLTTRLIETLIGEH
jgi:hypothetical protein